MINKMFIVFIILATLAGGYMVASLSAPGKRLHIITDSGTTLDLSGQQLSTLPTDVTYRNDIKVLNLSNNQLVKLPPEIGNMTNLEEINVENNRLVTLPAEIGKLTKLKKADFSNNRLTSLPAELGSLIGLKSLNLSGYDSFKSDAQAVKAKLTNTDVKF